MRRRPGADARALLTEDPRDAEAVHVFGSEDEARAYTMRVPGARTWAPTRKGWGSVLHAAITRAIRAQDLSLRLHHPSTPMGRELALEIAIALYDRGAVEVRDASGGVIRDRDRVQSWRRA